MTRLIAMAEEIDSSVTKEAASDPSEETYVLSRRQKLAYWGSTLVWFLVAISASAAGGPARAAGAVFALLLIYAGLYPYVCRRFGKPVAESE